MIRLPAITLPDEARQSLAELQASVDDAGSYRERVEEGKRLFKLRSNSPAFRPIREALGQMCAGARRCCYCEDSAATDVEHIWPKDFYPELVFAWENYLFGCPRCNRPKSNRCDIYTHASGERLSVPRHVKIFGGPPEPGDPVLINPRVENPLDFMTLDLRDTFFFVPQGSPIFRERATYTIELLKLNDEDVLPAARSEAYHNYLARLEKYAGCKRQRDPEQALDLIVASLKKMGHPTVWHEMKRQSARIPELAALFELAPEAMTS